MAFQFTPPTNLPTPAQQTSADPTQAAYNALAGLGSAEIDQRLPFLPPNGQFGCEIRKVRIGGLNPGSLVGFCFYIDLKILQSSLPEVAVGGEYSFRISGFNNIKAKRFAFSDLKQFMCAALAGKGLTPQWNGEGMDVPAGQDPWIVAAVQMCQHDLAVGEHVGVQTRMTTPTDPNGKPKLKALFFAAA